VNVLFLLPRWSRVPVGGYGVVYCHADALAARGHQVSVLHWAPVTDRPWRGVAAEARRRTLAGGDAQAPSRWHEHGRGVRVRSTLTLPRRWEPGLAVVGTSWRTVEAVARRAEPGWGLAFLQSFETWSGPAARVEASWRLPVHKLVIAGWLADKAAELDAGPVTLVPNFVHDQLHDQLDRAGQASAVPRDPNRVAMLWHTHRVKGSDVGMAALALAKAQHPQLSASVFSTYPRPAGVPGWVGWTVLPSRPQLRSLLDGCAMFLAPGRLEGWALPPAEAMSRGCALVATDIGGHRDYAEHDRTALLAPSEDPAALAAAVVELARDPARARRLAAAGRERIAGFTLAASSLAMENALEQLAGTRPGPLLRTGAR